LTTGALPVGTDAITASYVGTSQYAASLSAASDVTVQKDAASVAINSSAKRLPVGQPLSFRVVVSALAPGGGTPTGTVTFFLGGARPLGTVTLVGGGASLTTSSLPVGSYLISVAYSGDADFLLARSAPVRATVTLQSADFATRTHLMTSARSSTYGESITFTATVVMAGPVRGTPTGSVDFMSGGTVLRAVSLKRGRAVFRTSSLPMGSARIRAVYVGSAFQTIFGSDGSFEPSTSSTLFETVVAALPDNRTSRLAKASMHRSAGSTPLRSTGR
jgi:hypothetical protein